jgi:hypothetical protein
LEHVPLQLVGGEIYMASAAAVSTIPALHPVEAAPKTNL